MTFAEAVKTCFRKYTTFSGRASRSEFWKFVIFTFLASIALTVINSMIFGPTVTEQISVALDNGATESTQSHHRQITYDGGWLGNIFSLIVFLPMLTVLWRRLHDVGRPGWLAILPHGLLLALGAVWYLNSTPMDVAVPILAETDQPASETITVHMPQSLGLIFLFGGLSMIAALFLLVQTLRASELGTNRFGPNPNEVPT